MSLGPAEILVWVVVLVFVSARRLPAAAAHPGRAGPDQGPGPGDRVAVAVTRAVGEGSA